jgi:nucleotide-binding universal stress UspA family protein
MKKIITAMDFSENSESALLYAEFLAKQFKAELLLVHTYFPVVSLDANLSYDTVAPSTMQEEVISSFEQQLNDKVRSLKAKGIKAESELIVGSLSSGIADFAKEKEVDLIIIGKSPDNTFFDRLIGSSASSVINNTSVPVLIVPAHSHAPSFKNIIYGTELESEEKDVLSKVFIMAKSLHSKVTLIKVNADFELDIQNDEQLLKAIQEGFSKEQFAFLAVKADNVSEGLLNSAHSHKADLLVIARHHHNFFSELVNPGKSKEIINKTDIPLLVYDIEA